jgi:HK97 family phage portal protein
VTLFNLERRDTGGIHNPFESPTIPLSSLALDNIYGTPGSSDTGENVTPDTALALPTFWRCIGLLSTVIAGCPLKTYKDPGKQIVKPRILDPNNPNMTYTQYELWELVVIHIGIFGNAYVRKIRGPGPTGPSSGPIIDLIPIVPSRVQIKLDDDGNKIFEVRPINPNTGTVLADKKPVILTTFEVMHIPGMGYDGIKGLGVVEKASRTLGTAIAADRLAAKFYSKGSMLSGVINVKAPLARQAQADAIRNKWLQKHGGVGHAAEVAVLDAETTFQPLTIPPDQLQFLQSRRWETTEIARWFGIPPHLVGDVEKSTSWGTGIEQQNVGFIDYTVSGWTNRMQQRVARELVPARNQYSEFDLDRLMRGSMTERFTAYAIAIQWGWLTRNEARIKENMPTIDGLDEPLTPLNMQAGNAQTEMINPNAAPLGPKATPGKGTDPDDEDSDVN